MKKIKEMFAYREMIFSLVRRDLRGRYKGSVFGFLWTFINPLFQLIVYSFVFSKVMRTGIDDYSVFLFVALIPWMFFSTCISGGATCIRAQQDMVKKIYFPREVLPISYVTSQFINMLLSMVIVFLVLAINQKPFQIGAYLILPVIMILEYCMALGVTLLVSAVCVFFRDLEYVMTIITMAWQFLSPVFYSADQVPEDVKGVFYLNPMTSIISAYRDILYYGKFPDMESLLGAVGFSIVLLFLGGIVFQKLSKSFAEEL